MNRLLLLSLATVLLASPQAVATESPVRAYYKDDFILESPDGTFQLKIRGNIHLDLRIYQAEQRGSPHSIDMRRGRIDLQGRIHRRFTFRLQPELVGNPYLRNAWVNAHIFNWLQVRAGQMKVPFSSSWLTLDNNVNFVERGTSTPVYPFFDRGVVLWGELLDGVVVYNLGAFTGAGIDRDSAAGDIDDSKDIAGRIFLQPFRALPAYAAQGIYLVGQGTWGGMSVPTSRYEIGGLRSANYEAAIWRWRTEQIVGTDGRISDRLSAEVSSRMRWGAELHYLVGPLAFSVEYLEVRYRGIALYHDLLQGSSRLVHDNLGRRSGRVRSLSAWLSVYLTKEHKILTNGGWKTPRPTRSLGGGGIGALEVLARYSRTWTSEVLFRRQRVTGFAPGSPTLPGGYPAALPGERNAANVSILDGAHDVHEWTLGLSWTLNPMVRLQLNNVLLWAPRLDRDEDGENDNKLISGAMSNQSNPELKYRRTAWENVVMGRFIFKL